MWIAYGHVDAEKITEEVLRAECSKYGELDRVWIARSPPGFAFVWYREEADAFVCVEKLKGASTAARHCR